MRNQNIEEIERDLKKTTFMMRQKKEQLYHLSGDLLSVIGVMKEQEMLAYKKELLEERVRILKQKNCFHAVWMYVKDATDSYEQRTRWKCMCLNCNLTKELNPKQYPNIIYGKFPIRSKDRGVPSLLDVLQEYKQYVEEVSPYYEESRETEKVVAYQLLRKYNQK